MAPDPRKPGAGLGTLLKMGTQFAVKQGLQALNSSSLIEIIAKEMYFEENPSGDWPRLSPGDKALWKQRVQFVITKTSEHLGL